LAMFDKEGTKNAKSAFVLISGHQTSHDPPK